MGQMINCTCLDCGDTFTISEGGGFFFHLVRCEKCGETRGISFDELGELHDRYIKGLGMPYSSASEQHDRVIQADPHILPITEAEYDRGVEEKAGTCTCGGKFKLNAPARCPKCHSVSLEKGESGMMYD